MTTITEGMTPAQFITAMNNNIAELVINWSVNADSFATYTTNNATPSIINHDLRSSLVAYGQRGANYISALNNGFASTVHRFQDNYLEDIFAPETAYGEPTALVSDDGNQIDIWFVIGTQIYYSYSTDGSTFAVPVTTDINVGYIRNHILKVGNIYYHYVNHADTSIHLFTGTDKIHFTDQGEVIGLGGVGEWDHQNLGNLFVWKEDSNWYMLYEARSGVAPNLWVIGLATSSNGIVWTKYAGNPVISPATIGAGNPELPRVNNEVIKSNGKYYCYYHKGSGGWLYRAYSTDLHTWTLEEIIMDIKVVHVGFLTYGDQCLVQFNGKSYLFWSPSNQVDTAHIDVGIDNRTLAELLTLYP